MKHLFLSFLSFALIIACAGSKKSATNLTPPPEDATIANIPDWFLNPPTDSNYLFAPATATSRDMGLALKKAAHEGRAEIARQVESRMQGLIKSFTDEVGANEDSELLGQFADVNKAVTSQVLSGTQVSKQEIRKEGQIYRAYVLVQMPVGEANAAFLNQLKQRQNLYTRFRATKAYEELNQEVERFEQYKRNQLQSTGN